jgi:phage tail-like protein
MAKEIVHRLDIAGPDTSEIVELDPGTNSIGRQADSKIRLNHAMVSRQHAEIECAESSCQIVDLASANGTIVGGQNLPPNTPTPLTPGAVIEIGPFQLTYEQLVLEVESQPSPAEPKPKAKPKPKPEPEPEAEPPPPPSIPPSRIVEKLEPDYSQPPPGLSKTSSRYLDYLPGIYRTDFMARFLAIFESVLTPIEWDVDNFDIYLDPRTAPREFLPWLSSWFSITFDSTWSDGQRRALLSEAHQIFARRGTRWALSRVLEIYTGVQPEIVDLDEKAAPFTFTVRIPLAEGDVDRLLVERIIDASKPAHTNYELLFRTGNKSKK